MKRLMPLLFVAAPVLSFLDSVRADDKLKVVATLSSYSDIAETIGGEFVQTSFVAPPKFDPHFIEPKPSDILRLKRADLFIHSGLDLEAWRQPLLDAAAKSELRPGGRRELDLSRRISLLDVPAGPVTRAKGDIHLFGNPHYWVDPRNGIIIAEDIAEKLGELDPVHHGAYHANLGAFRTALEAKIAEWRKGLAPHQGTRLAAYHDSWPYLMNFAGLQIDAFLEPKPGIPPTPRQIQTVISYVRSRNVPAVIQQPYNPTAAAEQVAQETGAKLLILYQNVGEGAEASSYLSLIDYNISRLLAVLRR